MLTVYILNVLYSHNDFGHNDSTINTVMVIIIIILYRVQYVTFESHSNPNSTNHIS